ncbi:peptidase inhibitor family I36 protein [Nonomuraea lactucae]|uniref:peptidase inhibitor family I36 protein n=1 Tax=Nonomuraea lactucae TaxID=2249762 RepID=UPI000DE3CDC5|nr:peptidase inhibitor family I36 protein [Nonomuraea lactucae]
MKALKLALLGAIVAIPATVTAPAHATPVRPHQVSAEALQRAAEQCAAGEICFWRDRDYQGEPWRWMPSNGYRDMPPYLHDHVYSFYANVRGCFIDYDPREFRAVNIGDYARAYDTNFGTRIDAVAVHSAC